MYFFYFNKKILQFSQFSLYILHNTPLISFIHMEADKKQEQKKTQTEEKSLQHTEENKELTAQQEDKKDPETLSQGERMGLSKQQLRKLEKRLNAKKKKEQKEQQAKQKQVQKQKAGKEKQGKKGNKGKQKNKDLPQQYIEQFNQQKIPIHSNKNVPIQGQQNILVTSALPYVNNVPHLGNIIGCVLSADVYSRFKKLQGVNVLYICGTDQYGTATQVKALEQKKTPKEVCDYYNKIHSDVYKWFDIGFDHFGRTSTEWHSKICQQIFLKIKQHDRIKMETMKQFYCSNCDLFLADRFVFGTCPHCAYEDARGDQCDKCQKLFNSPSEMVKTYCFVCKNTPVQKETVHFFIDLPKIQQKLEKWIDQSSVTGKWSENSIATTKAWTKMGLKPKCITRDLKWGVSVPIQEYKQKVFYVWFDAPIGYISITANLLGEDYEKWWKSKDVKLYQFMGKDNIPFHTVIFPSSLLASEMGWTMLHHISTTEYLNYETGKFSKRNGTGVFGDSASTTGIPSEVWRYYLLVNRPQKSDTQFSWKEFVDRNNNQLLANLGNLCNRALKYAFSNYGGKVPHVSVQKLTEVEKEFFNVIKERYDKYNECLNSVEIKEGLKIAMQISHLGNKYLQDSKFWTQENVDSGRTEFVIGTICNFIRFLSLLFEPYMPSCSAKINFLLGCEKDERNITLAKYLNQGDLVENLYKLTQKSTGLREPIPLFTEYTEQQMNQWRSRFAGKQN